jgi:hypothetical protein
MVESPWFWIAMVFAGGVGVLVTCLVVELVKVRGLRILFGAARNRLQATQAGVISSS